MQQVAQAVEELRRPAASSSPSRPAPTPWRSASWWPGGCSRPSSPARPDALFSLVRSALQRAGESRKIDGPPPPPGRAGGGPGAGRRAGSGVVGHRRRGGPRRRRSRRGDCVVDTDFGKVDGRLDDPPGRAAPGRRPPPRKARRDDRRRAADRRLLDLARLSQVLEAADPTPLTGTVVRATGLLVEAHPAARARGHLLRDPLQRRHPGPGRGGGLPGRHRPPHAPVRDPGRGRGLRRDPARRRRPDRSGRRAAGPGGGRRPPPGRRRAPCPSSATAPPSTPPRRPPCSAAG